MRALGVLYKHMLLKRMPQWKWRLSMDLLSEWVFACHSEWVLPSVNGSLWTYLSECVRACLSKRVLACLSERVLAWLSAWVPIDLPQ